MVTMNCSERTMNALMQSDSVTCSYTVAWKSWSSCGRNFCNREQCRWFVPVASFTVDTVFLAQACCCTLGCSNLWVSLLLFEGLCSNILRLSWRWSLNCSSLLNLVPWCQWCTGVNLQLIADHYNVAVSKQSTILFSFFFSRYFPG